MDNYQSYDSVTDMADELPAGEDRILLREKAINLADLSGVEQLQFEARMQYVRDISDDGGFEEKHFTVFPWLLSYVGSKGSYTDKWNVLWYYKWILLSMPQYPAISKQQIEAALHDLKKHYLNFGSNEKVFHQYAYTLYQQNLGEAELGKLHYKKWIKFKKRDPLDDCPACILNRQITYLSEESGSLEESLRLAEPILSGKLRCKHVPKATYFRLILPVMQSGDQELCAHFVKQLGKQLSQSKYAGNAYNAHALIIYFTKNGEYATAIKWFEKYFTSAYAHKNMHARFFFYVAATYLFTHVNKDTIKLKLHSKSPFYNNSNTYQVPLLANRFDTESNHLATLFNKRNGNDYFSRKKTELLNL